MTTKDFIIKVPLALEYGRNQGKNNPSHCPKQLNKCETPPLSN